MNTTDLVHYVSTGARPRPTAVQPAPPLPYHELVAPLRAGIVRARQYLINAQRADGSWCARRASDSTLASQWILLQAYSGREHSECTEHAAQAVLDDQRIGGGWSRFPGGPVDLSTSVQAYLALKLAGCDPVDKRLSLARDVIRRHGGADAADEATRYFLALFGQIDYDHCPVAAAEWLLINNRLRRELAPLAVLWTHRPVRDAGLAYGVRELFVAKPNDWPLPGHRSIWSRLTTLTGRSLERRGWTPLRRRALDRIEAELLRHAVPEQTLRLGFCDLVLRLFALDTLGYSAGSAPYDADQERLHDLSSRDDRPEFAGPQPHISPVADTALVMQAIRVSGSQLRQLVGTSATNWLARPRQLDESFDTMELVSLVELLRAASDEPVEADESLPPGLQVSSEVCVHGTTVRPAALARRARRVAVEVVGRLVERQQPDGGWRPSDDGNSRSSADVTGAVLEALANFGGARVHRAAQRAIEYLRAVQRADGSWSSATGVRFVHGTSRAVCGLLAAGVPPEDESVAAGVNWLLVHQQLSGGWGELPFAADVDADDYAAGSPTASQTAWATTALVAAGQASEDPVLRGVQFLLETQQDDGRWREPLFTLRDNRTGRWFRDELQAVAWPLIALSRWAISAAAENMADEQVRLRLVGLSADD